MSNKNHGFLDILAYLVESYVDFHKASFTFDPDMLIDELAGAGFEEPQILDALQWLIDLRDTSLNALASSHHPTWRIYTEDEKQKMGVDIIRLLTLMERDDIINHAIREMVIDRIMALNEQHIDVAHIKWIMLFIFCFHNHHGILIHRFENAILMDGCSDAVH